MIRFDLAQLAKQLDGKLVFVTKQQSGTIASVTTDSRHIDNDGLFIALRGERFDGHEFAATAVANGAKALLVERQLPLDVAQIVVPDCHRALGQLGALVRDVVNPLCLALTGSNGKTTVKEMVAAICAQRKQVLFTAGNFNNDIGVPLTLLRLTEGDEIGVFELGANHPGEIDYTSALVRPDVALVNNVASAHLAGFGSEAGVARTKSEIFRHLAPNGVAIINADDKYAAVMHQAAGQHRQLTFGVAAEADIRATALQADAAGCYRFTLNYLEKQIDIVLPLAGRHQVSNALAASGICIAAGFSLAEIASGLAGLTPVKGRMVPHQFGRILLVDDSYNANPASVGAAIDWLKEIAENRVLVLGDLGELGDNASLLHGELGAKAKAAGINNLFCLGTLSRAASEAFGSEHFTELDVLNRALIHHIQQLPGQVTVLIKGSRSAGMERVVAALSTACGRGELI
ncbi:UDP-N-acetylmuramoyl-tripeptide--D-alanyl-D-alanine ligase [Shewanella sp. NFH-SH190041]|uniref:UDP-N-acetylmuramoyl-tripeptide--D-alanyl-D- alanine ligase n=1 Tax=Shewanella sp. NFH-SH190041 TaxID=2950245 RepID=UPI0021C2E011|nr:UDP-N-acetylmuramoyl-tripeptide--D-alanyl-D-alanine ligase [Shewanella sp. NFH-SH190041]BDM66045.1 UDP-N-acetylmuramoyl-tripeptide--D-alanyl-D-alanine ligase [Shewanella sp. NFH-SH190041]